MTDYKLLDEAIENSKAFVNFPSVLMAVSLHPEWLTVIPPSRKWAILHQIIFDGDINQLDQLLALQKSNKKFRLLTKTSLNETILDIASKRSDTLEMKNHIQKLIKLDEMLNYAKDCNWDKCRTIIQENPTYLNEKPPYRLYYVIHHMACADAIDQFEKFRLIANCKFDITLRANQLKINEVAEHEGKTRFARFMEKEYPNLLEKDDESQYLSDEAKKRKTNLITIMESKAIVKELDNELIAEPVKPKKTRNQVVAELKEAHNKQQQAESTEVSIVCADDIEQKAMIMDNLLCPITLAIFVDPVVAADGFTYERSAIEKWLKTNDRSPMTNQLLSSKLLSPNSVIKQIIQTVEQKA